VVSPEDGQIGSAIDLGNSEREITLAQRIYWIPGSNAMGPSIEVVVRSRSGLVILARRRIRRNWDIAKPYSEY
jgi:hypothetical protein